MTLETCEHCGTPVELTHVPEAAARHYEGFPPGVTWLWYEEWRDIGAHEMVRNWHSPRRCRTLRSQP